MKYQDMDEQEREALGNFLRETFRQIAEAEKAGTLEHDDDDPFCPDYRKLPGLFEES